ncbi:uncharacterized protein PHALS_13977 [Plasmopara halstedii]|uniref:Uncharacterized protein n=1 Tax=Plasmopara halstedii TaxID=4781 RepID=A0A0P1AQ84_PLAHL|nr:uncharacterized protein PHALS_13977 [Plasmopara halstedii]CEG43681.1 hypothetical protein PHALS_13977 [Plasmopara halstedii]|eukprot:XP_024580050.1 hypothetical protein PHALS_13977 [Plasmopara halstedii]
MTGINLVSLLIIYASNGNIQQSRFRRLIGNFSLLGLYKVTSSISLHSKNCGVLKKYGMKWSKSIDYDRIMTAIKKLLIDAS